MQMTELDTYKKAPLFFLQVNMYFHTLDQGSSIFFETTCQYKVLGVACCTTLFTTSSEKLFLKIQVKRMPYVRSYNILLYFFKT